jgi:hypothetical protein
MSSGGLALPSASGKAIGNTAVGAAALFLTQEEFGLRYGSCSTAMGKFALFNNKRRVYDVAVGHRAGYGLGYDTDVSGLDDNIFISNSGYPLDIGSIRIGTEGDQAKTYITGVQGTLGGRLSGTDHLRREAGWFLLRSPLLGGDR